MTSKINEIVLKPEQKVPKLCNARRLYGDAYLGIIRNICSKFEHNLFRGLEAVVMKRNQIKLIFAKIVYVHFRHFPKEDKRRRVIFFKAQA